MVVFDDCRIGFYNVCTHFLSCTMPQAQYTVYTNAGLAALIEELCEERDQSASEFFREAARRELQGAEIDRDVSEEVSN